MEQPKKGRGSALIVLVLGLLALAAIIHKSGNAPSSVAAAPVPSVAKSEPVAAPESKPAIETAPAEPDHNYAMEEDGEYGYESALSQDDKNAGRAVKPVIMVRYLGQKRGTYSVQMQGGQTVQRLSCKSPCDFIKINYIYAGQTMKTETVRTTGDSVMDAVFSDAMNDQLKPYRARQ